jgi:hypothetical protein
MYHDSQMDWGENAAANSGAGSWGTKRAPDKIVARFIDREVDDPWPINGHLTQAVSAVDIAVLSLFVLSFFSVCFPSLSILMQAIALFLSFIAMESIPVCWVCRKSQSDG